MTEEPGARPPAGGTAGASAWDGSEPRPGAGEPPAGEPSAREPEQTDRLRPDEQPERVRPPQGPGERQDVPGARQAGEPPQGIDQGQQAGPQQSGPESSGPEQWGLQQSGQQQSGPQQSGPQLSGLQQWGLQQSGLQQSGPQRAGEAQGGWHAQGPGRPEAATQDAQAQQDWRFEPQPQPHPQHASFHAPVGPYSVAGPATHGAPGGSGGPGWGGGPGPAGGVVAPPAPDERWRAKSVEAVPGTGFGLVQLDVPPVASGYAIGGLIAGIGGVLASTLVLCFGVAGAGEGWGLVVAGAFALLAGSVSLAGTGLGLWARRQIRHAAGNGTIRFTGRGVAVAAICCGGAGVAFTLLWLVLTLVVQFS